MARNVQPLQAQFPIANPDGTPSQYFLRWLSDRGNDIEGIDVDTEEALLTAQAADTKADVADGKADAAQADADANEAAIAALNLDALTDVDTTTTPPTDQQALVYDDASGLWLPGDVAAGGGGGGGGAFEFIERVSVTAATSVDIDLPDEYDSFRLELYLSSTAAADLWFRVTEDGFATVKSGASDYRFAHVRHNTATGYSQDSSDAQIELNELNTTGASDFHGLVQIVNAKETTSPTHFDVNLSYISSGAYSGTHGNSEYFGTNNAINGVRILITAGTITGFVKIYGIKAEPSAGGGDTWTTYTVAAPGDLQIDVPVTKNNVEFIMKGKFTTGNAVPYARLTTDNFATVKSGGGDYKSNGNNSTSQLQLNGTAGINREFVCSGQFLNFNKNVRFIGQNRYTYVNSSGAIADGVIGHYGNALDETNLFNGVRFYAAQKLDDVIILVKEFDD